MQRSLQIRYGVFILLFVIMVAALKFNLVPGMDNALFIAIQSFWVLMLSWLIMIMAFFMRLFFNAMRRFQYFEYKKNFRRMLMLGFLTIFSMFLITIYTYQRAITSIVEFHNE